MSREDLAALRQHPGVKERYLRLDPMELRHEAEQWVDQRLRAWEEHGRSPWVRLQGCLIADIRWPRERQIAAYIADRTPPGQR